MYTASGTYSIQPVTSRGWILVVYDQVDFAKHTAEILEFYGYQTSVAGSAAEALSVFTEKMDAVITDFRMTDGNGAELIAEMRRRGSRIPAVVMTAYADAAMEKECATAGALAVLPKPLKMGRLLALVLESVVSASA